MKEAKKPALSREVIYLEIYREPSLISTTRMDSEYLKALRLTLIKAIKTLNPYFQDAA